MALSFEKFQLVLKEPFGISRGVSTVRDSLFVTMDGCIGEAVPSLYNGETIETVISLMKRFEDQIPAEPEGVIHFMQQVNKQVKGNPTFKAAMSMLLWDRLGKDLGAPLYKIFGLSPSKAPQTSFTVGISTKEDMLRKVQDAEEFPILKIKLGFPGDVEVMEAIREITDKVLRVDANGGWTAAEAIGKVDRLAELGVEYVEQPCDREDLEGLAKLHKVAKLPLYVDETIMTRHDVVRVAGICDGVNLKLEKCGGIEEGLAIIQTARAHRLGVMIGCMVGSSVDITAAAHLTPLVDYADLDGHILTANDPYEGMTVENGWMRIPDRPGLGVAKRG